MGDNADGKDETDQGDAPGTEGSAEEEGSLLDDAAAEGAGDDDGADQPVDVAEIVRQAVESATEAANRIADKRINQVLKRLEEKGDGDDKGDGSPPPAVGPDPNAVRAARLAFREYLGGTVTFLGNEEREFAMSLGAQKIAARKEIDDDDEVGRKVAQEVGDEIKRLRKFYEARTKAALKKRGMLKESDKGDQPSKGGDAPGGTSEFEKGKQVAQSLYAQPEPAAAAS